MKKIMFDDKFGLTKAVLEGRKTMTRRVANFNPADSPLVSFNVLPYNEVSESVVIQRLWRGSYNTSHHLTPKYKVGEVVAVAQNYKDAGFSPDTLIREYKTMKDVPGWTNKMFVEAQSMRYFIRITNIRIERLQDISDEDCLKEGIYKDNPRPGFYFNGYAFELSKDQNGDILAARWYKTPRKAFAALIDKVSGKGTWKANPWVFVYDFELVK